MNGHVRLCAHALPPSLTFGDRAYAVWRVVGYTFTFALNVEQRRGGKWSSDWYGVEEVTIAEGYDQCFVRAFAVVKCGPPSSMTDDNAGVYCVRVAGHEAPTGEFRFKGSCQCFGYARWNDCKHFACLADACDKGEL